MNVFFKYLLDALGYHTHFLASNIDVPCMNHVLIVVNSLNTRGDQFLVDVGLAFPTFLPIPLDFEEESPVYSDSFVVCKYIHKDGKLLRYHAKSAQKARENGLVIGDDDWKIICTVHNLSPKDLAFFDTPMEAVYTEIDGATLSPFHRSIRAIAFSGEGHRAVSIKDTCILLENQLHCLEAVPFRDSKELLEAVRLYFPVLCEEAKLAVEHMGGILTFK